MTDTERLIAKFKAHIRLNKLSVDDATWQIITAGRQHIFTEFTLTPMTLRRIINGETKTPSKLTMRAIRCWLVARKAI